MKPPIPQPPPTGFDFASRFPNASRSAVKLNGLITDNRKPPSIISSPMLAKPSKNRIRQNSAGLNKTEQAFWDHMTEFVKGSGTVIHSQAVTLKIANGCRYTPDVFCRDIDGNCHAYEVKGFLREDAVVKIKVAASLYPWINFTLATKSRDGWVYESVFP